MRNEHQGKLLTLKVDWHSASIEMLEISSRKAVADIAPGDLQDSNPRMACTQIPHRETREKFPDGQMGRRAAINVQVRTQLAALFQKTIGIVFSIVWMTETRGEIAQLRPHKVTSVNPKAVSQALQIFFLLPTQLQIRNSGPATGNL